MDLKKAKKTSMLTSVFWIVIIIAIITNQANKEPEITTPDKLKYIDYKGLCIATSNVEYGTVTMKDSLYGHWENDWLGAKQACEKSGGRLPTRQELNKVVAAANEGKIDLNIGFLEFLYSSELISPYRAYAIKLKNDGSAYFESVETSGDYKLTGIYPSTRTGYSVRCVK